MVEKTFGVCSISRIHRNVEFLIWIIDIDYFVGMRPSLNDSESWDWFAESID